MEPQKTEWQHPKASSCFETRILCQTLMLDLARLHNLNDGHFNIDKKQYTHYYILVHTRTQVWPSLAAMFPWRFSWVLTGWRVICAHKSGSSVHTFRVHLYTHIGFICTHISGSSVHTELSGDGVGWGGLITFMFLCTHRHSKPYHLSSLQQTQAPFWGWGGVGW